MGYRAAQAKGFYRVGQVPGSIGVAIGVPLSIRLWVGQSHINIYRLFGKRNAEVLSPGKNLLVLILCILRNAPAVSFFNLTLRIRCCIIADLYITLCPGKRSLQALGQNIPNLAAL